jgi:hypothetical protein
LGTGLCGFVDPSEHGSACDGAEDFAREACGGESRGDDAEDVCAHGVASFSRCAESSMIGVACAVAIILC